MIVETYLTFNLCLIYQDNFILILWPGNDAKTDSFSKLLSMAERGNWTELRNARTNGLMPTARGELEELIGFFTKKPVWHFDLN